METTGARSDEGAAYIASTNHENLAHVREVLAAHREPVGVLITLDAAQAAAPFAEIWEGTAAQQPDARVRDSFRARRARTSADDATRYVMVLAAFRAFLIQATRSNGTTAEVIAWLDKLAATSGAVPVVVLAPTAVWFGDFVFMREAPGSTAKN